MIKYLSVPGCLEMIKDIATVKIEKRGVNICASIMFNESRIGYSYSTTVHNVREYREKTGRNTEFFKQHEEELSKVYAFRKLFFSKKVQQEIHKIKYEKAHRKIEE